MRASFDLFRWKVQCVGPLLLIFLLFGVHPVVASVVPLLLIFVSTFATPKFSIFDSKPKLKCAMSNLVGVTLFGMHFVTIPFAIVVLAMGLALDRNVLAFLLIAGIVVYPVLTFAFDTPLRRTFDLKGLQTLAHQGEDRRTKSCTEGPHGAYTNGNHIGGPR